MTTRCWNMALVLAAASALVLAGCGSKTERVSSGGGSEGEGEGEGGEGEGEGGGPANQATGSFESTEGTDSFDQQVDAPSAEVFAISITGSQIDLTLSVAEQAGAKVLADQL